MHGVHVPRIAVTVGVEAPAARPVAETVFVQLQCKLADRTQNSLRVTQDGGVEARYWKVDLMGSAAAAWSDTQGEPRTAPLLSIIRPLPMMIYPLRPHHLGGRKTPAASSAPRRVRSARSCSPRRCPS